MNKKLAILSIGLLLPIFSSCASNKEEKTILSYGTYFDREAREISGDKLYDKKDNENFILATYGDTSCGCWNNFSKVINYVCANNNLLIYKMDEKQIDDRLNNFGLKHSDDPAFYIIANKKIIKSYFYVDNPDIFGNERKFYQEILQQIDKPYIYLINEEQITSKVYADGGILYFMRESCPDCSYCTPNVLIPYLTDKKPNDIIYAFDLDPIKNAGDNDKYQAFKDNYHLSDVNDAAYGYGSGYVPMFQHINQGVIDDGLVYFNDTIADGEITQSYFSNERKDNLHYLDGLEKKILIGTNIDSSKLNSFGSWASLDIQNEYYQPFLEAFLNYYLN